MVAVVACLVALVAVGIAYATIPNGDVINACFTRNGGTLRVIDSSTSSCSSKEISLAWNVQGPQGPPGAKGDSGATNVVIRLGPTDDVEAGASSPFAISRANCLAGERATGGGFYNFGLGGGSPQDNVVEVNRPSSGVSGGSADDEEGRTPISWSVQIHDTAGDGASARAWVICSAP
jgi:hypothetical protein